MSNMDLLHRVDLEIVNEVVRICREHDLKYYMLGGTMLGAIRHEGFIPWDDDIDLGMPRKDYDKFVKYMKKHPNEKIFFSNVHSEKRYPNSWGKVRLNDTVFLEKELTSLTELHKGVFIDLHPIDNILPCFLKIQVKLAMFWSCVGK